MQWPVSQFSQQFAILGGNLLEWCEFSLYGFFSAVFAEVFFPTSSTFLSLLLTFASLASAFLMRPIGGLVLGRLGDRLGRRKILIISSLCMTLITLAIGLLPAYATIGIWSPIILTGLRLLGGFAISSELTGATLYQMERSERGSNKNFLAALVQSGMFIGSFISSFSVFLLSLFLSQQSLMAGWWRVLYLLAACVGVVVTLLRLQLPELPRQQHSTQAWCQLLNHWPQAIRGFFLPAAATAGLYFIIYQISYITHLIHYQYRYAMLVTVLSNLALALALPVFGKLANRLGLYRQTQWGIILLAVMVIPLFYLMSRQQLWLVTIGQLLFVLLLSPYLSINTAMLASIFPQQYRYALTAFILNFSIAIFGATTPMVSLLLIKYLHTPLAPGVYYLALCLVVLLALLCRRSGTVGAD